ncbi:hypothetical protein [Nocardia sp. NPDC051981]|uniref:hypothetical protein n=1 Tax=Nocardia sp. NPDC051981 TaxID=3155417 RepID=UPI003441879A
MLELQAIGDESEDCSGFYLEFLEFNEGVGECELSLERSDMRYKPTCLGYLRTDVSGVAQLWDQSQIRKLATRLGYDFADTVIYDPKFGRPPFARLKAQAIRLDAEAVIVLALSTPRMSDIRNARPRWTRIGMSFAIGAAALVMLP